MGIRAFNPVVDSHVFHAIADHHVKGSEFEAGLTTVDVPVVIIGGGPTGLLQGHLLSRLGGMLSII